MRGARPRRTAWLDLVELKRSSKPDLEIQDESARVKFFLPHSTQETDQA